MALCAEGGRRALDKEGEPLTAAKLKHGLESIKDFTADGLLPPVTITSEDHQGGGRGRVAARVGSTWPAQGVWSPAYLYIAWTLVHKSAAEHKASGKGMPPREAAARPCSTGPRP